MGQSSSVPAGHWQATLTFATDSLSNNTATLNGSHDALQYQISAPTGLFRSDRVTTFTRKDGRSPGGVLIAKWEKHNWSPDLIMLASENEASGKFIPKKDYLRNEHGWRATKRTFAARNGLNYTWRSSGSLKLYRYGDKTYPIASLSESSFWSGRPMQIKLARGYEDILDDILVTCILAEKKRRDSRRSNAAASGAAGAAAVGGGC